MDNELIENKGETDSRLYLLQKEIFSLQEACVYLCISQSYMYKLTSSRKIPHYSPMGKLIYFKRTDIDEWILKNKRCTNEQLEETAVSSIQRRKV